MFYSEQRGSSLSCLDICTFGYLAPNKATIFFNDDKEMLSKLGDMHGEEEKCRCQCQNQNLKGNFNDKCMGLKANIYSTLNKRGSLGKK